MASQNHHFVVYLRNQCGGSDRFREIYNRSAPAVKQAIKVVSYETVISAAVANKQPLPQWLSGTPTLAENKETPRVWCGQNALVALDALNKSVPAAASPVTEAPMDTKHPSTNMAVQDMFVNKSTDGSTKYVRGFHNPDALAVHQGVMDVGGAGAYAGATVDDDLYCSKIEKDMSGSSGRGNFGKAVEEYRSQMSATDRHHARPGKRH
jgi:hypothetical protein